MITVALEVPVVGCAFLLSVGLTDGAVQVEDQLFERLAPMDLVDPLAREIHQRREVAFGTERFSLEASDSAGGSGFLVRLCRSATDNMAFLIESGYDHDGILQFRQVSVMLTQLNGKSIAELATDVDAATLLSGQYMYLSALVECTAVNCHYIVDGVFGDSAFDVSVFESFVSGALGAYFESATVSETDAAGDSVVLFSIESLSEPKQLHPAQQTDFIIITLNSFVSCIVLFGLFAFAFNKSVMRPRCGCSRVDDANWVSVLAFSLQTWDFFSDILLSLEYVLSVHSK